MAHDKGVGMIEPALRDRLTAVCATWLDQDDFGDIAARRGTAGDEALRSLEGRRGVRGFAMVDARDDNVAGALEFGPGGRDAGGHAALA